MSVVCCQLEISVSAENHSTRGVLPSVACLTECDHEFSTMRKPWPTRAVATKKIQIIVKESYHTLGTKKLIDRFEK
jgi:hypothetical protein